MLDLFGRQSVPHALKSKHTIESGNIGARDITRSNQEKPKPVSN